jgi:hypothetical protein
MVNPFEDDRPAGFDEKKDKYPFIHPEHLGTAEKLAIDAEDLQEFADHYGDEDQVIQSESQAP